MRTISFLLGAGQYGGRGDDTVCHGHGQRGGLNTAQMDFGALDLQDGVFYDPAREWVECAFKLYPWEWMMNESEDGCRASIRWIEPIWKAVMSNKALLAILHELFPASPYILPAYDHEVPGMDHCRKPIFSRKGANIRLVEGGRVLEEIEGGYGKEGYVFQKLVEIEPCHGMYPVIGDNRPG